MYSDSYDEGHCSGYQCSRGFKFREQSMYHGIYDSVQWLAVMARLESICDH